MVTFKNQNDLRKHESTKVVTRIYMTVSDAQERITPELVEGSGKNLNSFKLLYVCPCFLQKHNGARVVTTFFP